MNGDRTMLIWLGKQRLGQKEGTIRKGRAGRPRRRVEEAAGKALRMRSIIWATRQRA